jgi:Cu2+-exporting ATPase
MPWPRYAGLGIAYFAAGVLPADKVARLGALGAGFASTSPACAAYVSRSAADLVFQGAARLVRQNLALALLYNAVAVPLAVAGLATPLLAAVAMSSSSLAVTLNALRLGAGGRGSG